MKTCVPILNKIKTCVPILNKMKNCVPILNKMKTCVPMLNKMNISSLEVYNWHQFVIIVTCFNNECPYLVLVHEFSSLEIYLFVQQN
jgi:hypothetical protein